MDRSSRAALLALAGGAALLTTACSIDIDTGGDIAAESYDVGSFDEIEITAPFEADIEVGSDTEVTVELDEELLDRVRVEVEGNRLTVGFSDGLVSASGPLELRISTPELTALVAQGAAEVKLEGLDAESFRLQIDGASDVTLDGTVETLMVEADGAAKADLGDLATTNAEIDVDGASNIEFGSLDRIDGAIRGAGTVDVPDGTTTDVETSGGGSIE